MSPSPVEELALTDLDRSNKGASKQRRDLINAEIAVMRDLLPLPESARQRLSQLQIMSLSCVYIRKCNVLHKLFSSLPAETDVPTMCDFSQALTGFLLITTREGKLVYISENVTDYLGHSMVDMKTQGDSLYDIVDKRDHGSVQAHLLQGGAEPDLTGDVTFFCRMNMSRTLKRQAGFGDVKVMHVRGHFLPLSDLSSDQQSQQQQQQQKYVFMATCSPLITPELKETLIQSNTMVFKTVHKLDMTFLEVTKTAEFHLGWTTEEICKKSWYSMLHPEDIHEAQEKHVLLMRASHELSCMMTVRMLTAVGDPVWVNVVMHVSQPTNSQADDSLIVCINQVISEEEAYQIRMQSHMFTLYPPRTELWNTATLSHPQPAQPDTAFWMTAASSMVSTVPGFSYPNTSRPVLSQQHHALPTGDYISGQDGMGYPINPPSSSPSTAMLSSSAQTDRLKLMLKRKLQGPCHQAKIPKMAWDETPSTMGATGSRKSMESTVTTDRMHTSQASSQFIISGNSPRGHSWPASTQVVPPAQYQVAHVFPVTITHQNSVKTSMLSPTRSLGSLSPPLCQPTTTCQGTEQVVPGNDVAVPESFLTPDPSPASSPNPQTSGRSTKTKGKTAPTSAAILKELEKLADLTRAKSTSVIPNTVRCIKMEKSLEDCHHASRQKELPIMDAFDIESFFHNLDFDQQSVTLDWESKQQEIISEAFAAKLEKVPVSKSAVPAMPIPQVVKQEPSDMSYCPLLAACASQQLQVQGQAKKTAPLQQPEVDPKEFEELLSYFSGDMTATQLNLDSLLSASLSKNEAGELDSTRQQKDNQESELCGAGHLGSFLLCSTSLERAQEGFSPSSNSDTSGDEDSSSEETLERLLRPDSSVTGQKHGGKPKRDGGEKHGCAPSFGPSPTPVQQATQDVPGINEEDELYQLNKLLSLMASDSGMMLSEESQ